MRVILVAALLLPVAGCLGTSGLEASVFSFAPLLVSDPDPVAIGDCSELLDELNERALREAKVSMHQNYRRVLHGWAGGGDIAFEAADDGATSNAGAGAPSQRSPEVTGTNNQEAAVDEADLLKTDGKWTYVLDGEQLHILRTTGVGNTTGYAKMAIGQGYGSQLLLDAGDPADEGDDRLIILSTANADGGQGGIAADSIWWGGWGQAAITIVELSDRTQPSIVSQHVIDGQTMGARLVDGTAYVVVYNGGNDLGLRTWVSPNDAELKARGLTWEEYYKMGRISQDKLHLEIAEDALAENERTAANLTLDDHLASHAVGATGKPQELAWTDDRCQSIISTPDDTGRGTNTILALDPKDGSSYTTTQIISGHPIVYGATDALVLASDAQQVWWMWAQPDLDESTNLHWFDLDGLAVSHRASGRVDGYIQDQFGVDVHDDTLRVATTTGTWGRWWLDNPEPMANHLVVFEDRGNELVQIGSVDGIAPDERIWSARFTDDRAYIVTFEQIDPLWVIDLADPSNPTILGELEVPGVSTYIHPLSDDALLTIGIGPGPNGLGLDWGSLQVSLFNITDPTKPTLAEAMRITPPGGEGWSWSAALHEHKAFTYWDKLGMLAVPVASTSYQQYWDESCNNGQGCWRNDARHFTGLRLIHVDEGAMDLSLYGTVDQDALLSDGIEYPRYYGLEVQRSYFLGYPDTYPADPVSVYAMSGLGVTAHDLASLELQSVVNFTDEYERDALADLLVRQAS